MTDISIPPEVRHAARAVIGDHVPSDTVDRALRAALKAWPGMFRTEMEEAAGVRRRVILPLPPPSAP